MSITTTSGTGAKIVAVTDDIGAITEINVQDSGFAYSESNPPEMTPQKLHFVVKDVTGTFTSGNTLTTHVGTVKGFDSDTGVLDTTFENVVRVEQESSSTFQQGIQLRGLHCYIRGYRSRIFYLKTRKTLIQMRVTRLSLRGQKLSLHQQSM